MPDWERAVVRVDGKRIGTGFVVGREHGLLLHQVDLIRAFPSGENPTRPPQTSEHNTQGRYDV